MTSRRRFLQKTTAGFAAGAVAGLGTRGQADAQSAASADGPTIDWHAHFVGPRVAALLAKRASPRPPQGDSWQDIDRRLQHLDAHGVERQVLSWVGASFDGVMPADEARPLWRAQNDDIADAVRNHPTRFAGLASLPTANVDWAAEELDRAHAQLGLIGAVLPLDAFVALAGARALAPVFAVAQKHRSHIYVHRGAAGPNIPGQMPELGSTNAYFGQPPPGGGAPGSRPGASDGDSRSARAALITQTHLATGVLTLTMTDFLDPYPDVTVQVAMIGGSFAFVAEQLQLAAADAGQPDPAARFRRVYVDTGGTGRGPRGIAMAANVFGADRILFGSDYGPNPSIVPEIESVRRAAITAAERSAIFVGNNRTLWAAKQPRGTQ